MPYLTPDEVPEGRLCRPLFIPDDTAWLALVSGILTEGTKVWNWEKFGTLTPEECAAVIQEIVDAYYVEECDNCELPEGSPVTRLSALGAWEELNGDEWTEPTGDREIPTLPPIEAPTEEERRCLAATNAASVLKDFYEVVTDAFGEELTLEQMIVAIAEAAAIRVGVWLGLLIAGEGILLFGILATFYAVMEFITMDLWTEEFDEKLICLLLYHAGNVGDTVVFDFNAFREDLVLQTNWFDPTFSEIRLLGQLLYLTSIMGAEGLNAAGATTAITEADCGFCFDWCCHVDLTGDIPEWLTITGDWWQHDSDGISSIQAGAHQLLGVNFEWVDTHVNVIRFTTLQLDTAGTNQAQVFDDSVSIVTWVLDNGTGLIDESNDLGVEADEMRVDKHKPFSSTPKTFQIKDLWLYGEGSPIPCGEDNCEE